MVTFEHGEPVREWSQLLWADGVDWNDANVKKAFEINQIDPASLRGQPTFEQVLPDLLLELSSDVWVAHNAEYDMRMLNSELKRLGRPALSPQLTVCTKNLASHFNETTEGNRLTQVAPRWGVTMDSAHRATVDARACGQVLAAMLRGGRLPREDAAMAALCAKAEAAWKGKHRWA